MSTSSENQEIIWSTGDPVWPLLQDNQGRFFKNIEPRTPRVLPSSSSLQIEPGHLHFAVLAPVRKADSSIYVLLIPGSFQCLSRGTFPLQNSSASGNVKMRNLVLLWSLKGSRGQALWWASRKDSQTTREPASKATGASVTLGRWGASGSRPGTTESGTSCQLWSQDLVAACATIAGPAPDMH